MEYLTKDELLRVLSEARKVGTREHCMFLMGYLHGLRASEIAGLTLQNVRGGKLRIQRLKHSLQSAQKIEANKDPLLDEQAVLSAWLSERAQRETYGSSALFLSRKAGALSRQQVRILFKTVCERAGVDSSLAHPHSLKHAMCEHMRQAGKPIEVIRIRAGHRDVKSTIQYFHVQDSEADSAMADTIGRIFA
jgi:type 1 fimbriae regulatory protein FimB